MREGRSLWRCGRKIDESFGKMEVFVMGVAVDLFSCTFHETFSSRTNLVRRIDGLQVLEYSPREQQRIC